MSSVAELPSEAIWTAGRSLPIAPESVASARSFTAQFLTSTAKFTGGHVDDVILLVSELVTNSIKYGRNGGQNIWLDVEIWSKWTTIIVDDRSPQVLEASLAGGELHESGRGLQIVNVLAERFWWNQKCISKTANAVVLRPNVQLTDEDEAILDRLETGE
jgi:anti-sigma regulatory factor (Ser/Thr protein kinase)